MKAYLNLFKMTLLTKLQYRAEMIAGIFTQLFFGFVYILVYIAFYESNGTSKTPMEWSELVTYVWLMQSFFAMIYPYTQDNELINMIKNGNLAYEIIRPQNLYVKYTVKMIANRLSNALFRCIPIIIISLLLPYPYNLALPNSFCSFILFVLSLLLGCILVSSLCILVHIITMFTVESKGVITFYSVVADIFSGSTVPLPFFPKFLLLIANILPFHYITDFPFRVYSGNISINDAIPLLFQLIAWIIGINIIGNILTKIALKKAVVQGG